MAKSVSMNRVVTYAVGFFLVGILLPIGLTSVYAPNVTGWDSSVTTVFQVVFPILAIIGIAIDYIRGPA